MLVKHFFPAPVRRAAAAYERVTRGTFPPLQAEQGASTSGPPSTSATTPRCSPTASRCGGRPTPSSSTSSWSSRSCSPARSPTRRRRRPRAAIGGWFVLNDWSARDVQADDVAPVDLRPGREVEDVRQLARLRRADGRRRARLAAAARAGAGRRRGVVRGRAPPAPAHDVGAMLAFAVRRRAAGRRRRHLDRDDARLLRAGARPLDRAGADGRAGDRRDRHAENRIEAKR